MQDEKVFMDEILDAVKEINTVIFIVTDQVAELERRLKSYPSMVPPSPVENDQQPSLALVLLKKRLAAARQEVAREREEAAAFRQEYGLKPRLVALKGGVE